MEFAREIVRIYRRYSAEFVEAMRICPWAEKARAEGRVREYVFLEAEPSMESMTAALDNAAQRDGLEIALFIVPHMPGSRAAFERFVGRFREYDAARQGHPLSQVFATASFHPEVQPDTQSPARLIPFLRSSPDPTIQVVRRAALDRVRANEAPHGSRMIDLATVNLEELLATKPQKALHERVAMMNYELVNEIGTAAISKIFTDIFDDRKRSYARYKAPTT